MESVRPIDSVFLQSLQGGTDLSCYWGTDSAPPCPGLQCGHGELELEMTLCSSRPRHHPRRATWSPSLPLCLLPFLMAWGHWGTKSPSLVLLKDSPVPDQGLHTHHLHPALTGIFLYVAESKQEGKEEVKAHKSRQAVSSGRTQATLHKMQGSWDKSHV
jgi:hypothetical protein